MILTSPIGTQWETNILISISIFMCKSKAVFILPTYCFSFFQKIWNIQYHLQSNLLYGSCTIMYIFFKCQLTFGRKGRHWLYEISKWFNLHCFFLKPFSLCFVSAHPASLRAIFYHLVNPLLGEAHLLQDANFNQGLGYRQGFFWI